MSAWLRKTQGVPGSAPGGLVWNTPEDVVEVEDEALAADLLGIPGGGFLSVPAPEEIPENDDETDSEGEKADTPQGDAAPAKPARKTAASKAAAKTEIQE
jgi:hypothetical protein